MPEARQRKSPARQAQSPSRRTCPYRSAVEFPSSGPPRPLLRSDGAVVRVVQCFEKRAMMITTGCARGDEGTERRPHRPKPTDFLIDVSDLGLGRGSHFLARHLGIVA